MSFKTKNIYQKRQFLNPDKTSSAYVVSYITKDNYTNAKGVAKTEIDASFDIADCYRKISLDFNVTFPNNSQVKEKLKKIRLFRQLVNEFADKLEETLNEALV